jgi:hypothetical protein
MRAVAQLRGSRVHQASNGLPVQRFNNHRLLEPVGNVPPPREMAYYAQLEVTGTAA